MRIYEKYFFLNIRIETHKSKTTKRASPVRCVLHSFARLCIHAHTHAHTQREKGRDGEMTTTTTTKKKKRD